MLHIMKGCREDPGRGRHKLKISLLLCRAGSTRPELNPLPVHTVDESGINGNQTKLYKCVAPKIYLLRVRSESPFVRSSHTSPPQYKEESRLSRSNMSDYVRIEPRRSEAEVSETLFRR